MNAQAEKTGERKAQWRPSLAVLQMPLPDLRKYLEEAALSNPLLELEEFAHRPDMDPTRDWAEEAEKEHHEGWKLKRRSGELPGAADLPRPDQNFTQSLKEQLVGMPRLEEEVRRSCNYLIDCLDERGYLPLTLQEVADERKESLFQTEQALYVLQSLKPAGVGARSLNECLILQLSQSRAFNAHTVGLVSSGLDLLARSDYTGIAELLGCTRQEAIEAADIVRQLEPIPSQGYYTGNTVVYTLPEADLQENQGQLELKLNADVFLPTMRLNNEVKELLEQNSSPENQAYLDTQLAAAQQLIADVQERMCTVRRLVTEIVEEQKSCFLGNGELKPMTMGQLAEKTGLTLSEVSCALQGKAIRFSGHTILLKELFTPAAAENPAVDSQLTRRWISKFVAAEDKKKPLSDEDLRLALEAMGISETVQAVEEYRREMHIPDAADRSVL